jgi:hypothetical protein
MKAINKQDRENYGVINGTAHHKRIHARLAEIKREQKKLKEEMEILQAKVTDYMGNNEILLSKNGSQTLFTWHSHAVETFDKEGLKNDFPEIFRRYTGTATQRRFLVK